MPLTLDTMSLYSYLIVTELHYFILVTTPVPIDIFVSLHMARLYNYIISGRLLEKESH